MSTAVETRIWRAWSGRVTGCMLGKPLEVLSFQAGAAGLEAYLRQAGAWPLSHYAPCLDGTVVEERRSSCGEHMTRAEADDDLNYTILALMLLEEFGTEFNCADVARQWLNLLPAGTTWTAERAAYQCLLDNMTDEFVNGADPGFDLAVCSENPYNDWIGAQIRADLYGWVCPGQPDLAAELAGRDASLSHRGEGVYSAAYIAALGAIVPEGGTLSEAIDLALEHVPTDSAVATAVKLGSQAATDGGGMERIRENYADLSPVHTVNNLALVIWALLSANGDFDAAITRAVTAGWDTDSNAATVGGLMGLSGASIDTRWTAPWRGRIATNIAGVAELDLEELVARSVAVMETLKGSEAG